MRAEAISTSRIAPNAAFRRSKLECNQPLYRAPYGPAIARAEHHLAAVALLRSAVETHGGGDLDYRRHGLVFAHHFLGGEMTGQANGKRALNPGNIGALHAGSERVG